ncbi:Phosphatidylserine decarboxylase [Pyrenophora teres f. teres]|uniref:Phosphatidylserine decarboxylase n=1 Tax=Pyrenophora teres f. teres TaxID=97479 RepID=A0A6S6WLT2_9PLEO|nr:Phosphatidylserine decarboxylase [Pyrenophora teres f. teres]
MSHQENVKNVPKEHHVHRTGSWLPSDHRVHKAWLSDIIERVENNPKELHPVLQEFKDLIEKNTRIYILVNSMFEEIPSKKPYRNDPVGHKQVRDYHHMLELFNHILKTAPEWSDQEYSVGMVGTPFNAILDWPMGTPSGFAFFLDPDVNKMLKKILNAWAEFLASPDSAYVLGDDKIGWLSNHGIHDLSITANVGQTSYSFEDLFECDPSKEHHGFKSWDHFFTRRFKEDKRPIASPEDDSVIANACESKPYKVARNIAQRDHFWIKGQPYSLMDMLAMDPLHEQFIGGTVYQAFLSALSYHRWHAPVSGKIVKAYLKEGTYFSEPLFEGLGDPSTKSDIDEGGETTGQGYLTATATRAIIFIEADNKDLGLVCFLGIGMTEVSTCHITVSEGQRVKKGDEIGMFHYGGSTHCVVFRNGVELDEFPDTRNPEHNVPVRSKLAVVRKSG